MAFDVRDLSWRALNREEERKKQSQIVEVHDGDAERQRDVQIMLLDQIAAAVSQRLVQQITGRVEVEGFKQLLEALPNLSKTETVTPISVTAPDVHVEGPQVDLSPLIEAVSKLRLAVPDEVALDRKTLDKLKEALTFNVALPGHQKLRNRANKEIDPATEQTLLNIQRAVTDQETRFSYEGRPDDNPVYLGKALQGTATSADEWTIQKFSYDNDDRIDRIEVQTGSWDDRDNLF